MEFECRSRWSTTSTAVTSRPFVGRTLAITLVAGVTLGERHGLGSARGPRRRVPRGPLRRPRDDAPLLPLVRPRQLLSSPTSSPAAPPPIAGALPRGVFAVMA
jgi:hypothetical protein